MRKYGACQAVFCLFLCIHSIAAAYIFPGGSIVILDVADNSMRNLPFAGFPAGIDKAGTSFFLLTGDLQDHTLQKVSVDGSIIETKKIRAQFSRSEQGSFSLSPDHAFIAYAEGRNVRVSGVSTFLEDVAFVSKYGGFRNICWLSDKQLLVEVSGSLEKPPQTDKMFKISYPEKTIELLYEADKFSASNQGQMAVSPRGERVAFVVYNKLISLDTSTKQIIEIGKSWGCPCWSAGGKLIAYRGQERNVIVYDTSNNQKVAAFAPEGLVTDMSFVGDSHVVYSIEGGMWGQCKLFVYDLQKDQKSLVAKAFAWDVMLPLSERLLLLREQNR